MNVEYWVMRIVLHKGPAVAHQLSLPGVQASVAAGSLAMHPDGHIMEPVELFAEHEAAHEHRAKMMRDDPSGDYRVIINAECPV